MSALGRLYEKSRPLTALEKACRMYAREDAAAELAVKDAEIERKTKALAECLCMIADSSDMVFADRIASENFETWQEIRGLAEQ